MKENSEDSPFVEEFGDGEPPVQPETEQPIEAESPAQTDRIQPVDKIARFEAEIAYLRDRVEESEAAGRRFKRQIGWLVASALLLVGVCGFAIFQLANRAQKQFLDLKAASNAFVANNTLPPPSSPPSKPSRSVSTVYVANNTELAHPFHVSAVSFCRWEQGKPPLRLIKRNEGLCFLTEVGGHFQGSGESVRLWIDKDGYWYLGGGSKQNGVSAECAVLRY